MFWLNVDIVSDVDLEDGVDSDLPFEVPKEVSTLLPPLTVAQSSQNQLTSSQIDALSSIMMDVRHILSILD
jgi:hypothetical protein